MSNLSNSTLAISSSNLTSTLSASGGHSVTSGSDISLRAQMKELLSKTENLTLEQRYVRSEHNRLTNFLKLPFIEPGVQRKEDLPALINAAKKAHELFYNNKTDFVKGNMSLQKAIHQEGGSAKRVLIDILALELGKIVNVSTKPGIEDEAKQVMIAFLQSEFEEPRLNESSKYPLLGPSFENINASLSVGDLSFYELVSLGVARGSLSKKAATHIIETFHAIKTTVGIATKFTLLYGAGLGVVALAAMKIGFFTGLLALVVANPFVAAAVVPAAVLLILIAMLVIYNVKADYQTGYSLVEHTNTALDQLDLTRADFGEDRMLTLEEKEEFNKRSDDKEKIIYLRRLIQESRTETLAKDKEDYQKGVNEANKSQFIYQLRLWYKGLFPSVSELFFAFLAK